MDESPEVTVYTDGACVGNPGPGGYAAVLRCGRHRREVTGGRRLTTNNRMELLAAVAALEALTRPCRVTVFSDSRYVVEGMTKGWAARWRANGWMRTAKDAAVNPDLWGRLLALCGTHRVAFVWVRGHAGDPENERCDRLAVAAAGGQSLPADDGYPPAPAPTLFTPGQSAGYTG